MNDFNRGALQVPCLRLDYGFGEQWASVELGDGTGYVRLADYEKAVAENAKLRERMDRLLTLLRDDCGIDASWDGLRKFWSIELTEGGRLMRDRACKAEAENAKLRAMRFRWQENDADLREENDRLRELVRALDWCMENTDLLNVCDRCPLEQSDRLAPECEVRMRELGIGVEP